MSGARQRSFLSSYGPWALVAGGSEGIGAAFAETLAARGLSLILAALPGEALAQAAAAARARGAEVLEAPLDLAAPDAAERLAAIAGEREVGLLVYNAAFVPIGTFLGTPLADKLRALDVNCRGPLLLADRFGPAMAARGRGGIVLLSSLAGTCGAALMGTYAATKAFNHVLAEALWAELAARGVDVLALRPGATRTPGWLRSRPAPGAVPLPVLEPQEVVDAALAALGRGPSIIPGRWNRLAGLALARLLPRRVAVAMLSDAARRLYPGAP